MAYVVTLTSFTPPPRADQIAFTKARIEEATTQTGVYTAIDTITLSPVDADPRYPEERELTTHKATTATGWYRVVWIDANGNETPFTPPIQNETELSGGLRPTIADVAALLRARTKVAGGRELGTFTQSTRPTADEVDDLITEAEAEVLGKVKLPGELTDEGHPPQYEARIRGAIRLYAAILIELSYFPEQVGSDKSPASTYEKLYDKRMAALEHESLTGEPGGGEEGKGGAGAPGDAAWAFPEGTAGLVGWASRW